MIVRGVEVVRVLSALEEGPATFSELVRKTKLPARDLAAALDELGRKGLVLKDEYWFVKEGRV